MKGMEGMGGMPGGPDSDDDEEEEEAEGAPKKDEHAKKDDGLGDLDGEAEK
jgi:hypothetical protein